MLSAKRVIAATALGLPLMLGAPGMALADDGGHGKPCHSNKCHKNDGQKIDQDQDASTDQANVNVPTQYTLNVGSGEANSVSWSNQSNDADTDQTEGASQEDD
ncbi:hypothetical protein [Saccharopolyspora shandongensis]|uniref:hypothetical protein n=1 Tax=Saccharopolyspora shandongensis TaxID=418495 RepID=UPI0033F4183C